MSRIGRSLLVLLLVLVLIVALCAVIVYVLLNQTFEQLGVSEAPLINGKSIADMKLEGYKPIEVLPLAKSLFTDNGSLVNYVPSNDDTEAVDEVFKQSDINTLTGVHYSRLIYKSANFPTVRLLELTDKQLCALLNSTVKQAPSDLLLSTSAEILAYLGSKQIKDILDILEQFDVTVEQIKLLNKADVPHMELLISLDISQYAQGFYVPFWGEMNSRVYVNIDYCLNVSDAGIISLDSPVLSVNGKDAELSQKVLDGLFIAMNNDENSDPISTNSLAEGVSAFIGVVFEHVGHVGNGLNLGACGVNVQNRTIRFESY